jgi:glycosyltransferase involved in cell wall biosynthesis
VSLLRSDPALQERLAQGALDFCNEHFDWKRNAQQLAAFYEQVSLSHAAAAAV